MMGPSTTTRGGGRKNYRGESKRGSLKLEPVGSKEAIQKGIKGQTIKTVGAENNTMSMASENSKPVSGTAFAGAGAAADANGTQ